MIKKSQQIIFASASLISVTGQRIKFSNLAKSFITSAKINFQFTFLIIILFNFHQGNTQCFYPDKPTPAELIARDKPYSMLQKEIETNLCDKDWKTGKQSFLYYKNYPELNEVSRGICVHDFTTTNWANQCDMVLKSTSLQFTDYVNHARILSEKLDSIVKSVPTEAQAYKDVLQNKGVLPANEKALLEKKKIAKDKCFNEMTHVANECKLASFFLFTNVEHGSSSDFGEIAQTAIKRPLLPLYRMGRT